MTDSFDSLKSWLSQVAPKYGLDLNTIAPVSGDASFRKYYRILGAKGSYVVMDSSAMLESLAAFIKVDKLLEAATLNVPIIYEQELSQGFLLLSDLGKQTYLDVINNDNANQLMSDATDALVKMQLTSKPGVLPIYGDGVLRMELELFPQWYLTRHLGMKLSPEEHELLNDTFDMIIEHNLSEPQVYVHRDYMPRNLMITKENNPGVIDFQDALYGPISYDVTCLCRDAFISWEESQVLDWTIRYWQKARAAGLPVKEDFSLFWEDVEWMGLQRHLKVIGIFGRICYRDGKPKYLTDVPRFFKYVNTTVHRYDALKPLAKFLDKVQNVEVKVGVTF